jgi:hypothetical protein
MGEHKGNNIKTFLRYALARYTSHQRDMAYRIYVTESLRAIGKGGYIKPHFADVIKPKKQKAEDTRTGEKIAFDVLNRIGIEVR